MTKQEILYSKELVVRLSLEEFHSLFKDLLVDNSNDYAEIINPVVIAMYKNKKFVLAGMQGVIEAVLKD